MVNRIMQIGGKLTVKVTGVYEDIPLNSQFHQLKFIAPFGLWVSDNDWIFKGAVNDWSNHFLRIYAEIPAGSSFDQANAGIKDIERRHKANFRKGSFDDPQEFLHPMSKWHLYPYNWGSADSGPMRMVWLVGIIGGIVLLLASH